MKTFETMKHNIPEGATHYSEEAEDNHFCWYIIKGDIAKIFSLNNHDQRWRDCSDQHEESDVKPIPTEPKYRYEKVDDSIFDLGEKFKNNELYFDVGAKSVGMNFANGEYLQFDNQYEVACQFANENIYRRVELTRRDLWIQSAKEAVDGLPMGSNEDEVLGAIFDKLVDGE